MKRLNNLTPIKDVRRAVTEQTIIDKIEYSGITKLALEAMLRKAFRRARERESYVLSHMTDDDVAWAWFRNYLHPSLKHMIDPPPQDIRGCSTPQIRADMERASLRFYENGQQNFSYTLEDILEYLNIEKP